MSITPEQFNKLVTKEELREMESRLASKEKLHQFKDEILGAIDTVVQKLDVIEHAFVSNQAAHDRFEQRITKIEQHLNFKPAI